MDSYLMERLYMPTTVAQISSSAVPWLASLTTCFRDSGPDAFSTKVACPSLLLTGLPNLRPKRSCHYRTMTIHMSKSLAE